jgi:diacylglycerol kinase (ATP)
MRVQIICNPKAGRGQALAAATAAAAVLQEAGWTVGLAPTSARGEAGGMARAAAETADLIIACGGDGTLSEVVNGLRGREIPIGFIPAGTGNDFAATTGLSRDPAQAARQILAGRPRPVDLLDWPDRNVAAVNVIGIGFDAAVAARMNRSTRRAGGACAYLSAIVMELARLPRVRVSVRVDGEAWEGEALLIALANAQSYGCGMRIAPQARVDDGLMDVVLVEPMGRLRFLSKLPLVFRGTHLALPEVHCWQAREIAIDSDGRLPVMVDGDLLSETPLRVQVAPGALRMWLP